MSLLTAHLLAKQQVPTTGNEQRLWIDCLYFRLCSTYFFPRPPSYKGFFFFFRVYSKRTPKSKSQTKYIATTFTVFCAGIRTTQTHQCAHRPGYWNKNPTVNLCSNIIMQLYCKLSNSYISKTSNHALNALLFAPTSLTWSNKKTFIKLFLI